MFIDAVGVVVLLVFLLLYLLLLLLMSRVVSLFGSAKLADEAMEDEICTNLCEYLLVDIVTWLRI